MASEYTQLLNEIAVTQNYDKSIDRCKQLIKDIEAVLNKRIISYFASENGKDANSMIIDEDAFLIENLLSIPSSHQDLVLILHSNGGYSISAERIIDVCRDYCLKRNDGSKFFVIVPKRAKSAATIVALGADKIYLRGTAELGPVDPQFTLTDKNGNVQSEPVYLYVDAIENLFKTNWIFKKEKEPLALLPPQAKLKLLDQCNYPTYVTGKKELRLSDSIIEKIARQKVKHNPKIAVKDFDIFRDPHLTQSHGRLINLSDLVDNGLFKEKIIDTSDSITSQSNAKKLDEMLWKLYVQKRSLLNDLGNKIVKTIEDSSEFFILNGLK